MTVVFASIFSKLSAFGNFAIVYSYKWIISVFCFLLFFGFMTLFLPHVAAIIYDVFSWLVGSLGVALIAIEIFYKFVKIEGLKR